MRIESSNIELYGRSHSEEQLKIQQSVIKEERPDITIGADAPILDLFDIQIEEKNAFVGKSSGVESHKIYEMSEEDYQKVQLLEKILSYLTGKEVKFILPKRLEVTGKNGEPVQAHQPEQAQQPYYVRKTEYQRTQSMKFKARGVVKTAEGREIEFDFKMKRQESFKFSEEVRLTKSGEVVDPLVINYNGNFTHLTKQKFEFDLDFDGASDQISFLGKGSGYLAFDRDENGKIDDGRELFGPSSGDGFRELSAYDEDGNGFIDEGDSVFNKLRIWNKDESGNDVLFALGEVGVGAIYLGNVATDYALGGSPLSNDGYIRSTGMFIKESGEVGSVHHVDLSL